ncbi:uncharacterized protein PRCAT00003674001 [Priceomyces carsonii]|uniref:uncharacterized protein n=1 Tax=Priceomyces carsonii TaxID=28549 RepID=UPI002EDB2871|nr:unnamed protein product [Priceomyces carsonii]
MKKDAFGESNAELSGLNNIHKVQKERIQLFYRLATNTSSDLNRRGTEYHHAKCVQRKTRVNPRNKHARMQEVRERYRQDKLGNSREKIAERQSDSDRMYSMFTELQELERSVDLETLIEEEKDLRVKRQQTDEELEQELEQMIAEVNICDNLSYQR